MARGVPGIVGAILGFMLLLYIEHRDILTWHLCYICGVNFNKNLGALRCTVRALCSPPPNRTYHTSGQQAFRVIVWILMTYKSGWSLTNTHNGYHSFAQNRAWRTGARREESINTSCTENSWTYDPTWQTLLWSWRRRHRDLCFVNSWSRVCAHVLRAKAKSWHKVIGADLPEKSNWCTNFICSLICSKPSTSQ